MAKNPEEMCRLVTGKGAWHIGNLHVSDGPHGVRAQEDGAKNNDSYEATCFPTASSAACSWDRELIGEMAEGIAEEAKALGVSVMLGPGVNIKRSPLCGRNFEYYSEDPFLAGELAVSYVLAMQKNGVGTSLKHFAGNSQETHRMTSNSMIDDRALHEIYLAAFEKVVKEAKPATVMAAYNYVNGIPACENSHLLTDILRKKWGYGGLVMSDWGACVDLPACLSAGMDVEMPDSCGNHFKDVTEALKNRRLSEKTLECAVNRIEALEKTYGKNEPVDKRNTDKENTGIESTETESTDKENTGIESTETESTDKGNTGKGKKVPECIRTKNHNLARKIEEESAVLLKNEDFLPLSGKKEIVIIGGLAENPRIQGGGSSHIHTERVKSFVEEFQNNGIKVHFAQGYRNSSLKRIPALEKEARELVAEAKEKGMPVLFFGGLTDIAEGEGYDRESFELPVNQTALLEQLLKINNNIGFISIGGAPYNMDLPSGCKALLQLYLGGEAAADTCVRLVLGEANPSGKLAESIPYRETDVPSYGNFGKQGEQKRHPDEVEYRESIFVGYRYYDTFRIPVRYCFGHGLSYTRFTYSDLQICKTEGPNYKVAYCIENMGTCAGQEISQVYVKNPAVGAFRAVRELRGFAKTRLNPGEKKKVEITLDSRAFSVYQDSEFQVIGGTYEIQVGASLQDIRLTGEAEVEGTAVKSILSADTPVPLSEKNFNLVYTYPRTHFSDMRPGEFTTKNSLMQMRSYSRLARKWICIGKLAVRLMYFPKPLKDPEVRMMLEGILEGNLDSVCNQSGGLIKHKTIIKIVNSANRGKKHE